MVARIYPLAWLLSKPGEYGSPRIEERLSSDQCLADICTLAGAGQMFSKAILGFAYCNDSSF